ncbi:MAG: DNA topoisomerase III, partial [Symbiobacteriaceae bacterium]|nr:DNA topoisomerase III [Symbiobacteriaceae bacterium]
ARYVHDNLSREKCPECGKFLLEVQGKRGRMLVCSDRSCGYRKSVALQTNYRCPNCHKKLEIRGEDEKRIYACICGFRQRVSEFEKRAASAGAGKGELQRFLNSQDEGISNNALAEQLAKLKLDREV